MRQASKAALIGVKQLQLSNSAAEQRLFCPRLRALACSLVTTSCSAAAAEASPSPSSSLGSTPVAGSAAPSAGATRAIVLDGRAVAAAWERELVADVRRLTELLGRPPGLGVVLVGSRPDSMLYVNKKQEACQKAGMNTYVHHLPESVSQAQLEAALAHACADQRVDGVLIQLPLPRHLSEEAVMEVLDPRKDVDGFHPLNMGRMLMRGRGVRLVPATPLGCIELLRRSGVDVQGKNCVVLGDSNIVGTPLAAMLRDRGAAAVTICHRRSYREWFEDQEQVQRKRAAAAVCLPHLPGPSPPPPLAPPPPRGADDAGAAYDAAVAAAAARAAAYDSFQSYQLPDLTRSADILVVAVGHPELVRRDWVRPGAVVIDVGINVISTVPRRTSGNNGSNGPNGSYNRNGQRAPPQPSGGTAQSSPASVAVGEDACCGDADDDNRSTTISRGTAVTSADGGDAGMASSIAAATAAAVQEDCNDAGGGGGSGGGSDLCHVVAAPYNRNVTFQVVGDVAFDEVSQVAGAITTVPGGVGPMTIAAVLHNTIKAARYRAGLETW
ncbi:hypothetical protein HYH03_004209 [Edaphochlamys debaryana]|uniref:methenyltetrahydrofolate cyclohydrolase n=1 Tax=Edaphochlamys debaryana TaxID=47281 RepID=A0A835YAJ9_9CHLO|nr:hypothetical protein HYH03_004209 [Edaphochlamys debaryana]|eukprot:KAG2497947.1 hypothetical protein HYH03_004209 [Edaphochlamys debaryana]